VTNSRAIRITYLAVTISVPILLLYPLLVYGDLMGMGGYDGFASPSMMEKYGVWGTTSNVPPITNFVFLGLTITWLLSLANLFIAAIIFVIRQFSLKKA
jgi:hypothetical protein